MNFNKGITVSIMFYSYKDDECYFEKTKASDNLNNDSYLLDLKILWMEERMSSWGMKINHIIVGLNTNCIKILIKINKS